MYSDCVGGFIPIGNSRLYCNVWCNSKFLVGVVVSGVRVGVCVWAS